MLINKNKRLTVFGVVIGLCLLIVTAGSNIHTFQLGGLMTIFAVLMSVDSVQKKS